jgi:hypothetical protein
MIYLDSSALVKRYIEEAGSNAFSPPSHAELGKENNITSV